MVVMVSSCRDVLTVTRRLDAERGDLLEQLGRLHEHVIGEQIRRVAFEPAGGVVWLRTAVKPHIQCLDFLMPERG